MSPSAQLVAFASAFGESGTAADTTCFRVCRIHARAGLLHMLPVDGSALPHPRATAFAPLTLPFFDSRRER